MAHFWPLEHQLQSLAVVRFRAVLTLVSSNCENWPRCCSRCSTDSAHLHHSHLAIASRTCGEYICGVTSCSVSDDGSFVPRHAKRVGSSTISAHVSRLSREHWFGPLPLLMKMQRHLQAQCGHMAATSECFSMPDSLALANVGKELTQPIVCIDGQCKRTIAAAWLWPLTHPGPG